MILQVILAVVGAAAVSGQACPYRNDRLSPFYWKGYENVCTKTICDTYPWLRCDVAREYIMDQAAGHWPEDILMEIEYLQKYFNTLIPKPNNQLPYKCTGVCSETSKQLQLERIFTDITSKNKAGVMETQRAMCIVIGPNIYYQQCGGNCKFPYGKAQDSFCVPEVTVSTFIWVYCPGHTPGCHKVRFEVPLSCSCKKMRCRKELPAPEAFKPIIPPEPQNWKPGQPIDPQGTPLGPINPGPGGFDPFSDPFSDPFGQGFDPWGLDPTGGVPVGPGNAPAGK